MSPKEQRRLVVLQRLADEALTQSQAAAELHLSVRQVKRLARAYRRHGVDALISKHRSRRSNHALPGHTRSAIVELCHGPYRGFGPTFTAQKLAEHQQIVVSAETVRKLLIAEQLWTPGKARRHFHPLRQRRPRFGELVQADGSPHHWFGDESPACTLLVVIDDATSAILHALFVPVESTDAYFTLFAAYFRTYGLPAAVYTDRHSIFRLSGEDATADDRTQLGHAFHQLDIELICARTPQAKGRVERANRTLQDRLVKELHLRNITDMNTANAYLPAFLDDHNQRYAVTAASSDNAHRPLGDIPLDDILVHRYQRTLAVNLMLQFENIRYALVDDFSRKRLRRGMRVDILRRLDGTLLMTHQGRHLHFESLGAFQRKAPALDAKQLGPHLDRRQRGHTPSKAHTPSPSHPWRRPFLPKPATP